MTFADYAFGWLARDDEPRAFYLAKVVLLTLGGAILVSVLLQGLLPEAEQPAFDRSNPYTLLFSVVVIAPIVETIIMWFMISVLQRFLPDDRMVVFVTAGAWAGMHSMQALVWGIVIFWPFVLFAITFLTWRKRSDFEGLLMATFAHALHNFGPGLAVAFGPAVAPATL